MKHFIFTLLTLFVSQAWAQVTGNAKLIGETDHSGIKVLFSAVSPTAQTDSTLTDISGNYSKTLVTGTYSIKFSKSGYYDSTYSQNIFVNGNVALDNIQLISTKFIFVSGTASGTWTKDKIYVISGNCFVGENDSLIVKPGVKILLNHNIDYVEGFKIHDNQYLFTVLGKLKMLGTVNDSITIENISKSQNDFISFRFVGYAKSTFNYVKFTTSTFEIDDYYGYPNNSLYNRPNQHDINNCSIKNLYIYYGKDIKIKNNLVVGNVYMQSRQYGEISCNRFKLSSKNFLGTDNLDVGADNSDSLLIIKNNIFDIYNSPIQKLNLYVTNLVFQNNYVLGGDSLTFTGIRKGLFDHNTFLDLKNISLGTSGSQRSITFRNNTTQNSNLTFKNNGFTLNATNNQFSKTAKITNYPGAGIPIAKNTQGSDIDTYLNVIADPDFSTAPLLKPTSPMIGAGLNGSTIGFEPKGTCLESFFYNIIKPSADTLSISGKVYVTGSQAINATITAIEKTSQKTYSILTDNQGVFKLDSLPKGEYIIKTEPLSTLSNQYLTTYFPKKASIDQAETLVLDSKITDMKIYLLSSSLTDIEDFELSAQVYPNPFKNELVLENQDNASVTITDLSGREIHKSTTSHEKITTTTWTEGIYLIRIENKMYKFIKE